MTRILLLIFAFAATSAWGQSAQKNLADFASQLGSGGVNNAPSTGHFYANGGAHIQRFNDRVFVGAATVNDGNFPNVTQDWLTQTIAAITGGVTNLSSANEAVLTPATGNNGGQALIAGAQTANFTNASQAAIGLFGVGVANNGSFGANAWGGYNECYKITGSLGSCYGLELDTHTNVATTAGTSYAQGGVVTLQLASGAGISATGQFDASAAIQIEANPMAFKSGIVFGSGSIGAGGAGGSIIEAATGHYIQWRNSGGFQSGYVTSSATGNNQTGINFTDGGLAIYGPSGSVIDRFGTTGTLGLGALSQAGTSLTLGETALTGTTQVGIAESDTFSATSYSLGEQIQNQIAASTTVGDYRALYIVSPTLNAGAAATNVTGIYVGDLTAGGTANKGISLNVSAGTGKYNIYATGTAQNVLTGQTSIGPPSSGVALTVNGASGQPSISATKPIQLPSYTVATLPGCNATLQYSFATVTDATAPTYNGTLTGGGAVIVPVFCNGSAWTSH